MRAHQTQCRWFVAGIVSSERRFGEKEYDGLPPNGLPFSRRERAAIVLHQKRTILRAKRSVATAGWADTGGVGVERTVAFYRFLMRNQRRQMEGFVSVVLP